MRIINSTTELAPLDTVRPHPRNPRQGDTGAIHESIEANGFYGAIIAQKSTGFILAGNHRWQAAQQSGATEIPVTWVDVDDDHALRILLADNRTNDLASYDDEALAEILREIHAEHGNLIGTGYDGDDLDQLLEDLGEAPEPGATPEAQPERADELQAMWQVKPGQLWSAGPHRIICGDATDPNTYGALLTGQQAEMVWTDPPYGVSIGEKNRMLNARGRSARVETDLDNDSLDEGALAGMLEAAFEAALNHTAPGGGMVRSGPAGAATRAVRPRPQKAWGLAANNPVGKEQCHLQPARRGLPLAGRTHLLRLEAGGGAPLPRRAQANDRLERRPAARQPRAPDHEARGACGPRRGEQQPQRGDRARPVRGQRYDANSGALTW